MAILATVEVAAHLTLPNRTVLVAAAILPIVVAAIGVSATGLMIGLAAAELVQQHAHLLARDDVCNLLVIHGELAVLLRLQSATHGLFFC